MLTGPNYVTPEASVHTRDKCWAGAGERCEFYRCSGWITLGHGNIGLARHQTLVLLVHWTVEINIKEMYRNWLEVYHWRLFILCKGDG